MNKLNIKTILLFLVVIIFLSIGFIMWMFPDTYNKILKWIFEKFNMKEQEPQQGLQSTTATQSDNLFDGSIKDFVETLSPYVAYEAKRTGINPLTILTHSGIETGLGKHMPGFNFAGIKWVKEGDFFLAWTWEYLRVKDVNNKNNELANFVAKFKEWDKNKTVWIDSKKAWKVRVKDEFRKYKNLSEGLQGYVNLLMKNRYKESATIQDPLKAIIGIMASGWGTDPNYTPKVKLMLANISKYYKP